MTEAPLVEAAVLVPVYRDEQGELRLVLVVRSPVGVHGGQIGLPGGKREPADASPLETALREAQEEIGLGRGEIDVLAALGPLDTHTSGFRVHPFLARIRPPAAWTLSSGELTAVLTPAVGDLADPGKRTESLLTFPGWSEPRLVDHVPLGGDHVLWGFTLRVLGDVLPRLSGGEWSV